MLGISWTEFLVIILVAICVVPAKHWPDVAKFLGRIFKYIRNLIWKVSDFTDEMQHRLDMDKPIDDLLQNVTNDVLGKNKKKKKISKKCK